MSGIYGKDAVRAVAKRLAQEEVVYLVKIRVKRLKKHVVAVDAREKTPIMRLIRQFELCRNRCQYGLFSPDEKEAAVGGLLEAMKEAASSNSFYSACQDQAALRQLRDLLRIQMSDLKPMLPFNSQELILETIMKCSQRINVLSPSIKNEKREKQDRAQYVACTATKKRLGEERLRENAPIMQFIRQLQYFRRVKVNNKFDFTDQDIQVIAAREGITSQLARLKTALSQGYIVNGTHYQPSLIVEANDQMYVSFTETFKALCVSGLSEDEKALIKLRDLLLSELHHTEPVMAPIWHPFILAMIANISIRLAELAPVADKQLRAREDFAQYAHFVVKKKFEEHEFSFEEPASQFMPELVPPRISFEQASARFPDHELAIVTEKTAFLLSVLEQPAEKSSKSQPFHEENQRVMALLSNDLIARFLTDDVAVKARPYSVDQILQGQYPIERALKWFGENVLGTFNNYATIYNALDPEIQTNLDDFLSEDRTLEGTLRDGKVVSFKSEEAKRGLVKFGWLEAAIRAETELRKEETVHAIHNLSRAIYSTYHLTRLENSTKPSDQAKHAHLCAYFQTSEGSGILVAMRKGIFDLQSVLGFAFPKEAPRSEPPAALLERPVVRERQGLSRVMLDRMSSASTVIASNAYGVAPPPTPRSNASAGAGGPSAPSRPKEPSPDSAFWW